MRTRRNMIAMLAVPALAIPLGITIATMRTAEAAVGDTIPLTVTNDAGRDEPVFLYVLGQSLTTGQLGYATASGEFHPWTGGANPPVAAPDVSITGPASGQSTTIQLPKLSGRVYFSFGQKLEFFLTPDGLVQPAPWNPSDPNHDILFDWSEYTLNDGGLWLNSSQVDMLSVPHAVGVTLADGSVRSTGRLAPDGRNLVFDALASQPGGWSELIHTRSDGLRVRALAPGKGIDAGLLSPTIMDSYIAKAWDTYRESTLTVVPFAGQPDLRYYGRTAGDTMTFTDDAGQTVASFQRPSTANVFGCDGALHAPNDTVVGPIARTLCAALNRTTLHSVSTQPDLNPAGFYQDAATNHYAREIHARMVDGRAYAFAFDDVGNFESLVHDGDPQGASITVTPF
ncbi:MAG: sugar hydrolase [Dactylosporangium sp.]|nr:sugar hydrolase [Dactylosporangium sp.]NNJ59423.1 sugar hydrolase [Dactylosporangium sp.]